jgi:hypothetical protein
LVDRDVHSTGPIINARTSWSTRKETALS